MFPLRLNHRQRKNRDELRTEPNVADKLTRGEALSNLEQAELEHWHARLDRVEGAVLARAVASLKLAVVEAQMALATAQLQSVTQRIQTLSAENAVV